MKKLYILLFTLLITSLSFGQTTVFQESFETGNSGTASETCNDNFTDFFTRTDGSDVDVSYVVSGMDGTFYFAAQDTDGAPCTMAVETLTFTGINIATYTDMTFALLVAEDDATDAAEDWDANTSVLVEINIDGGGYTNLLQFSGGGATNTEPGLDTDFDGTADGTLLTSSFQEFTAAIGTGTSADIRITFNNLDAGDEDIAIDNIRIIDSYVSSPTILLGSGLSGLDYEVGTGGPSPEGIISVSGTDLTAGITVLAPTDFEVSLSSGSGFAQFVIVSESGGTASDDVYVRLKAGLSVNAYSGLVNASSSGAADKTASVSGNVYNPPTNNLVITGAYDGPLSGGTPKGVELYVLADIPDLSLFGIGSANNGGGTDGQEFTFPTVAATAGTFIYVTNAATEFNSFFGFPADYTDGSMGINGDDAVELFENGQVIDVFGDIDVDGSGTAWDYLDGWAYRLSNTGPDGSTFELANWYYSGINVLDGETTNASAATPLPTGSYPGFLSVSEIDSNSFKVYPNPANTGFVNITSINSEVINAKVFDILGKEVIKGKVENNQLDVSNLNAGMYILRLSHNNATVTKKLVIQ